MLSDFFVVVLVNRFRCVVEQAQSLPMRRQAAFICGANGNQVNRGMVRRTTLESYKSDTPDWDVILDIDKLAEEYGIDIAIHEHVRQPNNPDYVYWNPAELAKVLPR